MKETDRLVALQNELEKIGCKTEITENSIKSLEFFEPKNDISIATYNDHRMHIFCALALVKELDIQNENAVEKSYPDFWTDFLKLRRSCNTEFTEFLHVEHRAFKKSKAPQ
ncbi:MAG: hypothetical protein U0T78_04855 [Cloacibacterium normanense]